MSSFWMDCKYGWGALRRNPGYALAAIISLALGIAANSVFFTILDTFYLRGLPVKQPEQLVQVHSADSFQAGMLWGGSSYAYSYPFYKDLEAQSRPFSGMLCRSSRRLELRYDNIPERVQTDLVSGNFFSVLGVPTAAGRLLTPEDEHEGPSRPVSVLSYGYWMRRFGGDPGILGKTVLLEQHPVTVVGVTAKKFHGIELGASPDIYIPVTLGNLYFDPNILKMRRYTWLMVFGRLKPGVTLEGAQAALSPTFSLLLQYDIQQSPGISDDIKQRYQRQSLDLQPGGRGHDWLQKQAEQPITILWLVVLAVLLIACANVAGMQLAQAVRRQKEVALRLGLGTSRWRLFRLLMTESFLLAFLGSAAGLLLGWWSLGGFEKQILQFMPLEDFSGLNPRVLGLTITVSFGSVLLFGLMPTTYAARTNLLSVIRSEETAVSSKFHDLGRRILVISQVSLAVLLLAVTGLFLRTLWNLYRIDPGYTYENLVDVRFEPHPGQYPVPRAEALARALADRVRALPGVKQVRLSDDSLFSDFSSIAEIRTKEHHDPSVKDLTVPLKSVEPGYFSMLGIPLLAGRDFSKSDSSKNLSVAIVNEAFSRYFFDGENPVGRRFQIQGNYGNYHDYEIIGLSRNAVFGNLRVKNQRTLFLCLNQTGFYTGALHVRTDGDPGQLASMIRKEMSLLDPSLPLWEIKTVKEKIKEETKGERVLAVMIGVFSAAATILAAAGIFGLLSFLVAARTREIGIRMALGAERSGISWMILKQTLFLAGIGVIVGLGATLAASHFLESMLYEVRPMDPITLVFTALFMGAVALIAAYIPARNAATVDPMTALRYE